VTRRALVIGASGYLGRHVVEALMRDGVSVVSAGRHGVATEDHVRVDVERRAHVRRLDLDVDWVFYLAGATGTLDSFDEYERHVSVNELGLMHLLDWIRDGGARPRVVYPSSRLVYAGGHGLLGEDAPKRASTVYAVTKLAGEATLSAYATAYDIRHSVFRIGVPYGTTEPDGGYPYGTIGGFLALARAGEDISLYGTGAQRRTFTHVSDVAGAMLAGVSSAGPSDDQVMNIGGDAASIAEVAQAIADRHGVAVRHVEWPVPSLRIESGDTVFDDARLRESTGYRYRVSLDRWLEGS
jgi:UDP-glucose 4-epimerase